MKLSQNKTKTKPLKVSIYFGVRLKKEHKCLRANEAPQSLPKTVSSGTALAAAQ